MGRIKTLDDLKWGSIKSFVKSYASIGKREPDEDNLILSKNMRIKVARYKDNLPYNNNVIVIGNAGAGKTRLYVKPNILQRSMSYVITDKSGVLYNELSSLFKSSGYTVKVLNSLDPERSDYYNPFAYIKEPDDIGDMCAALMASDNNEVYYQNIKKSLLSAVIGYVYYYADHRNKTMKMVKLLLDEVECNSYGDSGDNWKIKPNDDLDRRFLEVEATDPENPALKQYETFRIMCGTDKASIVNSLKRTIEALSAGVIDRSGDMDSLELDKLGDSKHILFIVRPNTGVNAELPALLYTQIFMALFGKAQKETLRFPVHCMMNDFPENGKIHEFPRLLLSMKKYDISCSIIVQQIDQIKNMYPDMWQTLIRNCSMQIYLGGRDQSTMEYIISTLDDTKSKVAGLVNRGQLENMSPDQCIVIATGAEAYLDDKY